MNFVRRENEHVSQVLDGRQNALGPARQAGVAAGEPEHVRRVSRCGEARANRLPRMNKLHLNGYGPVGRPGGTKGEERGAWDDLLYRFHA